MGTYQKASDLQKKLTPAALKAKAAPHRKKLLVLLVVLVVIVAGAYVAYRIINKPTASRQQTDAALVDATHAGSTDAAITKLQAAYDDAATPEGKAMAAYFLAAHYGVKADHRNALKYYRAAEDYYDGKNIDVILGIAHEADALNNKSVARTYYQKAIDYYKARVADDPSLQDIITQFETRLKALQ